MSSKAWRLHNQKVGKESKEHITRREARTHYFHVKPWPSVLLYGLLLNAGIIVNLP